MNYKKFDLIKDELFKNMNIGMKLIHKRNKIGLKVNIFTIYNELNSKLGIISAEIW
jgi:hypothetical protein